MYLFKQCYFVTGKYLKDPNANDLASCASKCCESTDCNTVFLFNEDCFLIVCNTTNPELCEPAPRSGEKFKNTYMLNLRSVGE